MIRRFAALFFALSTLAACQTEMPMFGGRPATPMDGRWASNDGVFVATFARGQFTSRFIKTNEVLAQGSYQVVGNQVEMQWLSVATQQQRAASCTIRGPDSVHCNQAGGGSFDLSRA